LKFADSGHVGAAEIFGARDGGTWTSGSSQPSRLALSTTPDGSATPVERVRIDSSGNVGIGTSSIDTKLHVEGATPGGGGVEYFDALQLENTQTANVGATRLKFKTNRDGTAGETSIAHVPYDGNGNAYLRFQAFQYQFYNQAGSSERVRIDSSGRLGVGTSTPSTTLHVNGVSTVTGVARFADGTAAAPGITFWSDASTNTGIFRPSEDTLGFTTAGTERMRITNSGIINLNGQRSGFPTPMSGSGNVRIAAESAGGIALSTFDTNNYTAVQFVREVSGSAQQVGTITCTSTNTSYNTSSDYRLKENVVPLTGAADRLSQLPVHRFNFIADPSNTVDGFLAHEAQDVVPECVTGTKDEVDDEGNPVYQGIDQSKLVPLLTAALQEALAKIETLEARLTAAGL